MKPFITRRLKQLSPAYATFNWQNRWSPEFNYPAKSRIFDDFDAPQITSEGNVRRSYPVLRTYSLGLSFNFQ